MVYLDRGKRFAPIPRRAFLGGVGLGLASQLRVRSSDSILFPVLAQGTKRTSPDAKTEDDVVYDRYGEYRDTSSSTITRPLGGEWKENPFGDGCWRSSWLYASLFVIRHFDKSEYERISSEHQIDVGHAEHYLVHFADHCATNHGFSRWKSEKPFVRDQLCPLLYLMACVHAFPASAEATHAAKKITKHLSRHEEHGRNLAKDGDRGGVISRGLGFVIEEMCDSYGVVYRFKSHDTFYAAAVPVAAQNKLANVRIHAENRLREALGKEKRPLLEEDAERIARGWHREYTQFMFVGALQAFNAFAEFEGTGGAKKEFFGIELPTLDKAIDGYSVFNAIAQLSAIRVLRGSVDNDCREWRQLLSRPAHDGWGPAFKILYGSQVPLEEVRRYESTFILRDHDNDLIMAQRPAKYMGRDATKFPEDLEGIQAGPGSRLVLDYVILKALALLWPER